jgi:hypothetical protein
MLKFCIVVSVLLVASAAEAQRRVTVTAPTHRPNAEIICPWVSGSVAWDWPAAQQRMMLGVCPPPAAPR